VGSLLAKLDDLGIADSTIVVFSTDNGAEKFTWPDGGESPFRGEKGGTWEGGFRVPCVVRWPGVVKPGSVINGLFSHEDWAVTLLAAAVEPDVKEKLAKGHVANGKTFKVHLDGYDQRELLAGQEPGKRQEIFYFDDSGNLNAVRVRDWKATFAQPGDWLYGGPPLPLAFPRISNLRMDPFEAHVNFAEALDGGQDVGLRADAGAGRVLPAVVQGVPAAAEVCQLQHRPGNAATRTGRRNRQVR
jgi:arylsulfatase